jgi:hypothetical protein
LKKNPWKYFYPSMHILVLVRHSPTFQIEQVQRIEIWQSISNFMFQIWIINNLTLLNLNSLVHYKHLMFYFFKAFKINTPTSSQHIKTIENIKSIKDSIMKVDNNGTVTFVFLSTNLHFQPITSCPWLKPFCKVKESLPT